MPNYLCCTLLKHHTIQERRLINYLVWTEMGESQSSFCSIVGIELDSCSPKSTVHYIGAQSTHHITVHFFFTIHVHSNSTVSVRIAYTRIHHTQKTIRMTTISIHCITEYIKCSHVSLHYVRESWQIFGTALQYYSQSFEFVSAFDSSACTII